MSGYMQTVDTPTDISIREDQARIRKQLHEKGKVIVEQDPKVYAESFTFRLRQWKNTQFAGLWELCVMDKSGRKVVETVSDADALTNCLENIGGILENRGF